MNKRGFIISVPQIISGILAFFIAILGIRIITPFTSLILGFTWVGNPMTKTSVTIVVYLLIFFIIYVIVYGTIFSRTPNVLGIKGRQAESEYEQ